MTVPSEDELLAAIAAEDEGRALRLAKVRLKANPNDPLGRLARGTVHAATGKLEAGASDLACFLSQAPEARDVWILLGRIYLEQGRPWLAITPLRRANALSHDIDIDFALVEALAVCHHWAEASAQLEQIVPNTRQEKKRVAYLRKLVGSARPSNRGSGVVSGLLVWLMEGVLSLLFGRKGSSDSAATHELAVNASNCPHAGTVRYLDPNGSLSNQVWLRIDRDWSVESNSGSHIGKVDRWGTVYKTSVMDTVAWNPDDPPVFAEVVCKLVGDSVFRGHEAVARLCRDW